MRHDIVKRRIYTNRMQTAGNRLKEWREYRRLTQSELAEKVGTSTAVISHLETERRGLSAKWLYKLAPALGTTPGYLLDHDPNDLPRDILEIWAKISEPDKEQARRVLSTFAKTGT